MSMLTGSGVALITPFTRDGAIDFDALERLIESQINGRMDYLVSLGTTGETATLSKQEKQDIWDFTAKVNGGRVKLVAGIGGNNTMEIVDTVRTANLSSYQAILSVSPYYNKPTQEGIYRHYEAVAQASPLPIILYNVPGRTGSFIESQTTLRLANDFENIIATKEASANFDCFTTILRDKPQGFELISGDDPLTLPIIAMGGVGVISVVANAFPEAVVALVHSSLKGDLQMARSIQQHLQRITQLCFVEGNPAGVKFVLKVLGVIEEDYVRLPLVKVSSITQDKIRIAIDDLSIFLKGQ